MSKKQTYECLGFFLRHLESKNLFQEHCGFGCEIVLQMMDLPICLPLNNYPKKIAAILNRCFEWGIRGSFVA